MEENSDHDHCRETIQELRQMVQIISSHVIKGDLNEYTWNRQILAEIRASEQKLHSAMEKSYYPRREIYEVEDRIAYVFNKTAISYFTIDEIVFAMKLLEQFNIGISTRNILAKMLPGGQMLFPSALDTDAEFARRIVCTTDCISITLNIKREGTLLPITKPFQEAMRDYGALGATVVSLAPDLIYKVYFRQKDEERAVLMKCSM